MTSCGLVSEGSYFEFCYLGMTPLMYCVEPAFSVPSTAYVTLICVLRLARVQGPAVLGVWMYHDVSF